MFDDPGLRIKIFSTQIKAVFSQTEKCGKCIKMA
jgi:hypothetical protein